MRGRLGSAWSGSDGVALAEVLIVACLLVAVAGMAVPLTTQAADSSRARAAAGYLAARLRLARLHAIMGNQATALVFDEVNERWGFRRCVDGNGNGVRRAEIASGRDACESVWHDVNRLFAGVDLRLGTGTPDVDNEVGDTTGVRFGRAAMASCTPEGHCTPGTLYVRSSGGRQFAVRVSAVTGRTRLLGFDTGRRRWAAD